MRVFLKKHWRKFAIALVSLPVVGYLALCLFIGLGVHGAASDAQTQFPGNSVAALISVATSEEAQLSRRNRAIWALGQLGASEALPILQSLVSNELCDHESKICQHELEQAILGCSGGTNIGAVVWRHGDLAVASEN
jgi:hypothetical protein